MNIDPCCQAVIQGTVYVDRDITQEIMWQISDNNFA